MSEAHLSAEKLQQYLLDRSVYTPEEIAHLDMCAECQTQVSAYALLMKGLSQQPPPAFGFDVSAMVMSRLGELAVADGAAKGGTGGAVKSVTELKIERRAERRNWLAMAVLIILATTVPAWLFRKSAYYVFTDFPAIFLYLILAASSIFLLLRILHLMRRYQHIINIINK